MTEINLCSPTHEEQSEEINLCSTEQEEQDSEINLCPEEAPDCSEPPELFLTGTDAPTVGSTYSASGGTAPYSYSFDSGSISSTGEILSINACGAPDSSRAGIVSVTDACSQTAEIDVRLPGGYWGPQIVVYFNPTPGCGGTGTCTEDQNPSWTGLRTASICTDHEFELGSRKWSIGVHMQSCDIFHGRLSAKVYGAAIFDCNINPSSNPGGGCNSVAFQEEVTACLRDAGVNSCLSVFQEYYRDWICP